MRKMYITMKTFDEPAVMNGMILVWRGKNPHFEEFERDFVCLKEYDGDYCVFMFAGIRSTLRIEPGAEIIMGTLAEEDER